MPHNHPDRPRITGALCNGLEPMSNRVDAEPGAVNPQFLGEPRNRAANTVAANDTKFLVRRLTLAREPQPRIAVLRQEDQVRMFRVVGLRAFG